jgi:hypothetical protein
LDLWSSALFAVSGRLGFFERFFCCFCLENRWVGERETWGTSFRLDNDVSILPLSCAVKYAKTTIGIKGVQTEKV